MNTKMWVAACAVMMMTCSASAGVVNGVLPELQKRAETGPPFLVGATSFGIVPGALVRKAASNTDGGNGLKIGPYVVDLASTAGPANVSVQDLASEATQNQGYLVAINRRSGAVVLVTPHLKVFVVSPGQGASLAQLTGGQMLLDSTAGHMVVLGFQNAVQAYAALDKLQHQPGVKGVEIEVIQNF